MLKFLAVALLLLPLSPVDAQTKDTLTVGLVWIGVSLLCPGGVNTNLAETGRSVGMTPEREKAETRAAQVLQGGVEVSPAFVGESVLKAVREERFLILTDPINEQVVQRRALDMNAFMEERLASLSQGQS